MDPLFATATRQFTARQFADAEQSLRTALAREPNVAEGWHLLGV